MGDPDRAAALERFRELEGWAEYVFEAILRDPKWEPVKRETMERVVGAETLKRLREMSWSLKDKLHVLVTELELSPATPAPSA